MLLGDYILQKSIGKGSFGEVYLTTKLNSSLQLATKKMDKKKVLKNDLKKYLNNEIFILKNTSHSNIIKLYDIKQSEKYIFLITEYCNGGSLSKSLEKYMKINKRPFTQEIVQYLMRQVVAGVQYLHNKRIIHRDLKLDNLLLNFPNLADKEKLNMLGCQVKIIDFGFARYLPANNIAESILGSPINMSPQILENLQGTKRKLAYDCKADIYSLGTICFEMIVGVPPFDGTDCKDLINKVEKGEYKIPANLHLSKEAISFINGMMQYEPSLRLDINELANHDFLTKKIQEFTPVDLRSCKGSNLIMNIKADNGRKSVWNLYQTVNNLNLNQIDGRMIRKYDERKYETNIKGITGKPVDYLGNVPQSEYEKLVALTHNEQNNYYDKFTTQTKQQQNQILTSKPNLQRQLSNPYFNLKSRGMIEFNYHNPNNLANKFPSPRNNGNVRMKTPENHIREKSFDNADSIYSGRNANVNQNYPRIINIIARKETNPFKRADLNSTDINNTNNFNYNSNNRTPKTPISGKYNALSSNCKTPIKTDKNIRLIQFNFNNYNNLNSNNKQQALNFLPQNSTKTQANFYKRIGGSPQTIRNHANFNNYFGLNLNQQQRNLNVVFNNIRTNLPYKNQQIKNMLVQNAAYQNLPRTCRVKNNQDLIYNPNINIGEFQLIGRPDIKK